MSRTHQPIVFWVAGQPISKGSTKSFHHPKSGKLLTHSDTRAQLKPWEHTIRVLARVARGQAGLLEPLAGAVALKATFCLLRPRTGKAAKRERPHVKPDLSKLIRGIEDALIRRAVPR